ncbi:unnamed protein product [Vitrella brassicaformis CCMP3155]|uniref:Uncharacterized protein n=1 Tax=Vitrella brassicaformis (strain CCMP3155) TaxID=1169540 RepID=A0A0G4ERN2_VITBC|nr:unnamed protein product [Vitrella brassicaformis CCMP3155]|eukprot:CEM00694.1 unnamed protein product [Vitrella brassicaformis CCMP3155]
MGNNATSEDRQLIYHALISSDIPAEDIPHCQYLHKEYASVFKRFMDEEGRITDHGAFAAWARFVKRKEYERYGFPDGFRPGDTWVSGWQVLLDGGERSAFSTRSPQSSGAPSKPSPGAEASRTASESASSIPAAPTDSNTPAGPCGLSVRSARPNTADGEREPLLVRHDATVESRRGIMGQGDKRKWE